MSEKSAEQRARDMLERMGVAHAQNWLSGELVELANLIADHHALSARAEQQRNAAWNGALAAARDVVANLPATFIASGSGGKIRALLRSAVIDAIEDTMLVTESAAADTPQEPQNG